MSPESVVQSSNEELTLNDIEKALNNEDTPETDNLLADTQDKEPAPKKTDKEGTKEDKEAKDDEELELAEDEDTPDEADLGLQTPPRRKEILAKYPNIFKDFPYLQSAFYREQQFTELFPTLEDAKEVKERADEFSKFESSILGGNTDSLLKSVKASDEKAFAKIVDDYLPALARTDQAAYYTVLGNVIKSTISSMVGESQRLNNEDLKSAALLLNQFVFGTSQFAEPVKFNKNQPENDDEKQRLQTEREQFMQERFESTRDDLSTRVDNILKSTISQNIDPKGQMTDYVKRTAAREVFESLETAISEDSRFKTTLDKLWEVAFKDNFSKRSVDAIRNSYLGKAKNLLPQLLQKSRNDALKGLGKRVSEPKKENKEEKEETRTYTKRESNSNKIPHSVKTLDFLNQD